MRGLVRPAVESIYTMMFITPSIRLNMNHIMGALLRILINLILCVLLVSACGRNAWAYTDPGSGALLWQTLAAASFGLVFYLRKLTQRNRSGALLFIHTFDKNVVRSPLSETF